MWPLILLSIPALAILLERWIFFISHPFPVKDATALTPPDAPGVFAPFFEALFSKDSVTVKEKKTTMAAKELLFSFNKSLDFLSTIATVAPLLGLLGTVVGLLADGIWHALLTTAAGLVIAIPVLLAHQWFSAKVRQIAFDMESYANRILDS